MSGFEFELEHEPEMLFVPNWPQYQYGQLIPHSSSYDSYDMMIPYHHVIPQQQNYVYSYPMPPRYAVEYNGMLVFNPLFMDYLDDVAVFNAAETYTYPYLPTNQEFTRYAFEDFLEDSLRRQESRASPATATRRLAGSANVSGLSEEKISERLRLETAEGKMSGELCSICLCEFEEKQQIGRLECGHGYHVDCIKRWLLSKNVCPMCRSTAFTV